MEKEIIELYEKGLTMREVGSKLEIRHQRVAYILKKHNIKSRPRQSYPKSLESRRKQSFTVTMKQFS